MRPRAVQRVRLGLISRNQRAESLNTSTWLLVVCSEGDVANLARMPQHAQQLINVKPVRPLAPATRAGRVATARRSSRAACAQASATSSRGSRSSTNRSVSSGQTETGGQKSTAVIHENSGGHPEMGAVQTPGARGFESRLAPRLFFWLPRCPSCFFCSQLPTSYRDTGATNYRLPNCYQHRAQIPKQPILSTNWETKTLRVCLWVRGRARARARAHAGRDF